MISHSLRVFFAALLILMVNGVVVRVSAQGQEFTGLDVLFLVDQSGSMGGADYGYAGETNPRDPDGIRFEVLRYALETLSQYQVVVPENTPFRMAVAYFGDRAQPILDWTAIGSGQAWESQATAIADTLSAANFQRNLGNTNFISAFELAQSMFAQLPSTESNLRVLVVLTDGAPCAPSLFSDPTCSTPRDQDEHMEALITYSTRNFPEPHYRLHVIALDQYNQFWQRFAEYWQRVVGASGTGVRVETVPESGQQFLAILASSVEVIRGSTAREGTIGADVPIFNQMAQIDVPPYHQLMRLTLFKGDPTGEIILTDPQGVPVREGSAGVTIAGRSGAIETWSIANPMPGRWQLEVPPNGQFNLSLDLIRITWELNLPTAPANRYLPLSIQIRLVDSQGQSLPVYGNPQYALNVLFTAHLPSGLQEILQLFPDGFGAYTSTYIPLQEGAYTFDLLATTQNVDGSSLEVINERDAASLNISSLGLTAEISPEGNLLVSQGVDLTARIINSIGETLIPPDTTVQLLVTAADGTTAYDLVASEDQTYRTSLTFDQPGQYQLRLRATVQSPDGSSMVLGETAFNPFQVQPAAFVLLRVVQPLNNSTETMTTGFPPLTPVGTRIEVQAVLDTGEAVDLAALAGGSIPILVSLSSSDPAFETRAISLMQGEALGSYTVDIPDLPAGEYQVTVEADHTLPLPNATLFDPRTYTQTVRFTRSINSGLVVFFAGLVVIGLLIIGLVAFIVLRNRAMHSHPARGKLEIYPDTMDNYSTPLWTLNLDREKLNKLRRTPSVNGIKRVEVTCPSPAMSNARQVIVTIETEKGKVLDRVLFHPQDSRYFTAGRESQFEYYVVKDRDFEDSNTF